MPRKNMTIEDLAVMTKKGFDDTNAELHSEVGGLRKEMNERFNRIENLMVANYDRRFERIEDNVRLIKTALKMR